MVMHVKITTNENFANLMATVMDQTGSMRGGELLMIGLIAMEEQHWFALNVAVQKVSICLILLFCHFLVATL